MTKVVSSLVIYSDLDRSMHEFPDSMDEAMGFGIARDCLRNGTSLELESYMSEDVAHVQ